jgi:hypothetical protein
MFHVKEHNMISNATLNVAIGLLFSWTLLSLMTIQIQEWINARLDKRARDLEDAISEMLANANITAQFYDHPVIRGLTAKKRKQPSRVPTWFYTYPIARGFVQEKRRLPSYISSQNFSAALFDILLIAGTESSLIQQGLYKLRDDLERDKKTPGDQAVIDLLDLLADLARSAAATEAGTAITNINLELLKRNIEQLTKQHPQYQPFIDTLLDESERLKTEIDEVLKRQRPERKRDSALAHLRRGIAALSVLSPELSQTLSSLLLNVEEYATPYDPPFGLARKNVEMWFQDAMDRVSGVFKRYSQYMALFIGFIVAVLFNVDSINLTLYLWREPSIRQVLQQQAANFEIPQEELQANPQEALQNFRNQFVGLDLPVGWFITRTVENAFVDPSCQLIPTENQVFGIPVLGAPLCLSPSQSSNQTNFFLKLMGIFITAIAVRQGALLWFDILQWIANPRATGPRPAEKESK